MKVPTVEKLLEDQLKDIYNAEKQLIKALPKMAKAANGENLRDAFTSHLEETREQVNRLDQVGKMLGMKLTGKKCKAMEGLIEEGQEALEMEGPDGIIDTALVAAAQKVEHYEISAYGTARALAERLGHNRVAKLLDTTLEEESATDEKLTQICQSESLPSVEMNGSAEDEEEE
jgi:ferritin-like metal-binding protein YciE